MACEQSFKVEASKSLLTIGSGWGGGGDFFGWGNKVNYGKCANGEQELILARPTICAFVSFFSAMHWNNLSDFIYICFNISKI